MGEVETKIVRRDQASLLSDVRAEPMTQRGMQKVGSAMIGAHPVAAFHIDPLVDRLADGNLARDYPGAQDVEPPERFRSILNFTREAFETG